MTTALVFPGQGSQRPGMASPWRNMPSYRRWAEADDILGFDVTRLGLEAHEDELREPANCQVALFVHGVVVLEAWRQHQPSPAVVAGHSLGEYNALVAAQVLGFPDALRLVHTRARETQTAARSRPGTMVACLGYEVGTVREVCDQAGAYVANDNAPGQIVVAGPTEALDRVRKRLSDLTGRGKVVDVNVGAAYHSPHMEPAVAPFSAALSTARFAPASVPVVANVDAQVHTDAGDWAGLLRRQLVSPVRWRETVETLAGLGVTRVVELGASAVLNGLVKRTNRSLERLTVTAPDELEGA